jgi:arylsulfatase A-like enzyme
MNYMDAHFPYIPPAPFDRKFPGKNDRITQQDLQDVQGGVVSGKQPWPDASYRHSLGQYDGGIAYIDAQIGQVVDWLKQRNLYDNTLIVITSDHGEAFGEKNLVLHGNSVYQNLLHVALLIKFPHGAHNGVIHDPVSLVDVMPTVLNALGYEPPKNTQGRNVTDVSAAGREIYSESFPCPVMHSTDCPNGCNKRAVFSWPYKFITSSSGKYGFYDLSHDPAEDRDLAVTQRAEARDLGLKLSHWVRTMPAQSRAQLKPDPEALQRLKSLGYVQ